MKNIIFIFLFATLIFLTGSYFFEIKKKQSEISILKAKIEYKEILQSSLIKYENKTIPIDRNHIEDNNLPKGQNLVLLLPSGMCHVCYETFFEQFANYSKKNNNTLIVTSKDKYREVQNLINEKKIPIDVLIWNLQKFDIAPFNGDVPLFFIFDKDHKLKNCFLPEKGNFIFLEKYLKNMNSILNNTF